MSHAKFIVIDHAMLLLTSANFSFSAENRNIEFGLRIHDPALAASVETTMTTSTARCMSWCESQRSPVWLRELRDWAKLWELAS